MTNKEAIEYLKWIRPKKPWSLDKKNTQTAIDKAINALEQQKDGRWIPVSERLPEVIPSTKYTEDVLVSDGTDISIGYYVMSEAKPHWRVYEHLDEYGDCDYKVKAWSPLPQPYKAESEGV